MHIDLYINTDDVRVFPKQPQLVSQHTGTIRGELNVYTPTIRIAVDNPVSFNYVYIQELNRYYYVENTIVPCTGMIDITLKCDVLQSHYAEIIECPCILERSANHYNAYINDNSRKFYQYENNEYLTIGEFSYPSIPVIATVG